MGIAVVTGTSTGIGLAAAITLAEGEHTIGDLVDRAARRSIPVPVLTAARCNFQAYEINRTKQ